ncbi:MAG: hypothetical protein HW391_149 [Chloroflexi bacterium]|nr:hypothetical protein [Chloroflexota bacterium]
MLTSPVTAGGISRLDAGVTNVGKQNLSQSRLLVGTAPAAALPAGASLLATVYGPDAAFCTVAADGSSAACEFGSLRRGQNRSVSFLVRFATAGAATIDIAVKFAEQVNDNGSNEDTFHAAAAVTVGATTCDAVATFVPPGQAARLGTDFSTCTDDPQTTALNIPGQAGGALAFVGEESSSACAAGKSCFGQGSRASVNGGANLGILVWTISWAVSGLPNGFNPRQSGVVHLLDDGSTLVIENTKRNACKNATQVNCLESFGYSADGLRLIAIIRTPTNGVMRGLG